MLVDDSSYACLHLHKRIVLTMSNKTAVKCSDVRYNFAKSICMHLLLDMCKDISKILHTARRRRRERMRERERERKRDAIKFPRNSDEK